MTRPRKRPGDRRVKTPSVRLTEGEHRLLAEAAGTKRMRLTEWMRETLVRAARRTARRPDPEPADG